jgi:hypothetical protein
MVDTVSVLACLVGPCPQCGNGRLRAVSDGEATNFLCPDCGACWHPELDWVARVDPLTCPGCEHRARCLAALQPAERA